ncbi:hypothetical protein PR202_gb02787 [Eleusine coracana subsp. coracana]|uniref:Uncharacterized protein n=1 Tax=Eleusine coracana subsp. coracana TaxID=191504 RepID=A0AAV5E0A5_ELECO|nr:hypothetical protein QOZ80_8BG0664630 [Eleusine coracana subsp. coracana]GJN15844.1 hypothetical protein PR202_gb02787 [Eleusine coracana subsp. coracana]
MANGGVDQSPEAEEQQPVPVPKSSPAAAAPTKGRGLRRWRRIRRELHREGDTDRGGGRGDEDSAKLHKRRIPFPAGAPKAKHESAPAVEDESSSTASVESRFIPQAPAKLGFRVAFAGFTIGADSDHSDDRSSRSSTLHGRHPPSRDDRLRVHAAAGPAEPENSRSIAESDPRCSVAWHVGAGITGNGVHKVSSASLDHIDEEQQSEDVRSTAAGGYCEENGSSVLGRLARRSADSDDGVDDTSEDDGSVRNGKNGGFRSGDDDPYAESVLLLQRTQEALENEIEKLVAVGKVPNDEFGIDDDERSGSVHLKQPIEEVSEKINHLESRLEETSAQIKEKDSRILELEDLSQMQPRKTAMESTNLLLSPSELDGLYQEKIEVEIQGIILTRAYQTVATLAGDQMALYEAQKSLSEDYKQLGLKLRHAENRALMLEEKADKLEVQCQELIRSSEVLQLQSKASRVSLFSFIQFILLCIAIATYLMRLVPASSTDAVPT